MQPLLSVIKGPFAFSGTIARLLALFLVGVATVTTQLGGPFVWMLIGAGYSIDSKPVRWLFAPLAFALVYLTASIFVFPIIASAFGRVPLNCYSADTELRPHSLFYCLANRNYVTSEMAAAAASIATDFKSQYPERNVYFLDAGFPIGAGFPMLPHMSHGDGRRLDLMFQYQDDESQPVLGNGSPIGYFAFEQPVSITAFHCPERFLTLRWDMNWFQGLITKPRLDEAATRALLVAIANEQRIGKALLEPHLKTRLKLGSTKVRFQGCRAARHDDHVHIQL